MKWSTTVAIGFIWAAPVLIGLFVHPEAGVVVGILSLMATIIAVLPEFKY